MALSPTIWISVPLLGGVIGYVTNYLAVRMLFRPLEPRRFLGIHWQGLIGRRQKELAASIGQVVGDHLVRHEDVAKVFGALDLEGLTAKVLDRALAPKIAELRRLPLVGSILTEQRVSDLRASLLRSFLDNKDVLYREIEVALENGLDVHGLVEEKVAKFPIAHLEQLVLDVSRRELRAIEVLGGVLGFLVGLVQVGVLALL
jgi:uncharacterized membrane protein YheB (UPF0754 family)